MCAVGIYFLFQSLDNDSGLFGDFPEIENTVNQVTIYFLCFPNVRIEKQSMFGDSW